MPTTQRRSEYCPYTINYQVSQDGYENQDFVNVLEAVSRRLERVGKTNKYICMESYRNEAEKTNLLYWQVTCEAFFTPNEWLWWFRKTGYKGDYSFIYFE